ncbi:DUF1003 domain-containing protein [Variovorax sp. J22G21]|uniref:DUF1003 domain-containing protein n=1 Tax=Variovorax fucosicus TaxID=3053517 RepID=UPI0025751C8F|nr:MULTISPECIES: DUF1003 domain-containing protein [unclassified Variovorax]MDM0038644.1 DUF1003 domain-containing protein [Variovorax sp. J22R193]MDM0055750.1 DUF1003 domain-containing protein [Variovorax sp. J22G47]MDM0063420.1 DUF1003 domain-containing protein [Variovorax sp. J22G21]
MTKHDTHPASAPTIEALTRHNIETILCLEDDQQNAKPALYRAVSRIAAFCGTLSFLAANAVVFVGWILVNQLVWKLDPYPFTFLLFLVSLEAIFLSILILISQNMSLEQDERRHHLDLQINLLTEREMTAMLRLVTRMASQMGIEDEGQREVRALTERTDPGSVLHQIVAAETAHGH